MMNKNFVSKGEHHRKIAIMPITKLILFDIIQPFAFTRLQLPVQVIFSLAASVSHSV